MPASRPSFRVVLPALLVAWAVLAMPVECGLVAGPHSLFVDATALARLQGGGQGHHAAAATGEGHHAAAAAPVAVAVTTGTRADHAAGSGPAAPEAATEHAAGLADGTSPAGARQQTAQSGSGSSVPVTAADAMVATTVAPIADAIAIEPVARLALPPLPAPAGRPGPPPEPPPP